MLKHLFMSVKSAGRCGERLSVVGVRRCVVFMRVSGRLGVCKDGLVVEAIVKDG